MSIPRYFHGQPGAHIEITLAGLPETAVLRADDPTPAAHLIAFSLGAHRALLHAAEHGAERIDLIAPAAPLHLGDFLPHMAGAPVFKAAQNGTLARVTTGQATILRLAPGILRRLMFAGAPPTDHALFQNKTNRTLLRKILRHSLIDTRAAYEAALEAYVTDWQGLLPDITCPVTLWHGTADTWAPLAMSQALATELPSATLQTLPALGHYSALTDALPRLVSRTQSHPT